MSKKHSKQHSHSHFHIVDGIGEFRKINLKLIVSILLNLTITLSEIVGGILSGSLALISDAMHNLTDSFSLIISLIARKLSTRQADIRKTFGYKRAEILAALINGIILVAIAFFLFKEAFKRLYHPPDYFDSQLMLIVAVIGFLGNVITALLLYKDSTHNLNIRAAFAHIVSDGVSSVAVIIVAIILLFKDWFFIDAILTFIIGLYVLYLTFNVIKESVNILMQGVPKHIDINKIEETLRAIPEILNIHHVHLWSLTENDTMFECHIRIDKQDVYKMEVIKQEIKSILSEEFSILHSTLEFEFEDCGDPQKLIK